MSDVQIVFPKGRDATIRRLREALAQTGYDVAVVETEDSGAAPPVADGTAALFLWDRSTFGNPVMEAAASAARRRGRAIDVSADGITPMGLDDDRELIQLSGWRGDPHHPGWRKILARLEQPSGRVEAPKPEPLPPRQPSGTDASTPDVAATAGADKPGPTRRRSPLLALAAGAVLVVAAAALLIFRQPGGQSRQPPPAIAVAPAPAQPSQPVSAPPAQATAAAPQVPVPDATGPIPAPSPDLTEAARPARKGRTVRHAERSVIDAPRRGGEIRYTRYSRNMRLFCEHAGRRTPQCRVFNLESR